MASPGGGLGGGPAPQRPRPLAKRPHQPAAVLDGLGGSFEDRNEDFLCPICFELISEAHITRCGHTFCHRCISRSLEESSRCPKCGLAVGGREQVFPNFLLNELVAKHKARVEPGDCSLEEGEGLRGYLANESRNLSLPDVNTMLEVLTRRKQTLEAESCAAQNRLLREFLEHVLRQKEEQLARLTKEVALVRGDMAEVEGILETVQEECSKEEGETGVASGSSQSFNGGQRASDSVATSLAARRKRMHSHFDDFVQCYFASRAKELAFGPSDRLSGAAEPSGLDAFRENLVRFSRYESLRPLATLNYSTDVFNNSTIVSSIEFDRDEELFAIAGVTKRIKVFDYNSVVRDAVDIHYPCAEMVSGSKISCVAWNSYHKSTLASSDYEGTVTVWDASTGQRTKTFQEHEKRCWSVDFNSVDTRLIASGSDDARVKLWSLNVDRSVASLEAKANVCCVKFNPRSSCHLAFGSADHCVHYYDLRNTREAVGVFRGHRKAVSYVKFLDSEEIVSASTDSQLKVWNVNQPHCLRSLVGHTNEKNFVGLATDGDYVACGSEDNALYVYYKGLTRRLFGFRFDAARSVLEGGGVANQQRKEDEANEFVSAVCWRQNSNVVVAANSQGVIKVLELV